MAADRDRLSNWLETLASASGDNPPDPVGIRVMRRDGSTLHLRLTPSPTGEPGQWLLLVRDVTADLKQVDQLRSHSSLDPMTATASRAAFTEAFARSLATAKRANELRGLLWIDIDGFKGVNDRHGHSIGDAVLVEMAHRLRRNSRVGDVVGRMGGDEFCVLLERITDIAQIDQVADRILDAARAPITVEGLEVLLSLSVGVSTYPRDGDTVTELLRTADSAMYSVKRTGGDSARYFQAEMELEAQERAKHRELVARGLRDGTFLLYYQPITAISTGEPWGAEALLRLKSDGDILPAQHFIPTAERSGQIRSLTSEMLQLLTNDLEHRLPANIPITMNLSPGELSNPRFAAMLRNDTLQGNLKRLIVEVTEHVLMDHQSTAYQSLQLLRSMGARVAIDDYGSGFSNLKSLATLEPSYLKIEGSLVRLAGHRDQRGKALLKATVDIGQAIGAELIAEGVESEADLKVVTDLGIALGQGFYLGRPAPPGSLKPMNTDAETP